MKKIIISSPPSIIAFAYLDKVDSGKKYSSNKYGATFFWEKNDVFDTWKKNVLDPTVEEIINDEWPRLEDHASVLTKIRDGDKKKDQDTGKQKDGYADRWYASALTKHQPGRLGVQDGHPVPLPENMFAAGGDLVKAKFTAFAAEVKGQKYVSWWLHSVILLEKNNFGVNSTEGWGNVDGYENVIPSSPDDQPDEVDDPDF